MLLVSVVIGTYNRRAFLKKAIGSVRKELTETCHEIIVVDGGSTDGTLRWLVRQRDIITLLQHNHGSWNGKPVTRRSWGYFMNLGFKCAQGKYILMISDDSLIVPKAISNGIRCFEEMISKGRNVGGLAFYWRNWPEQKEYWVGHTLGNKIFVNHGLFLRSALADVGWVDENLYQFYHADGDLCLKLWQAGYEILDCPQSFVEHYFHANSTVRKINMEVQKKDWDTYLSRWLGVFYKPEDSNTGGWRYQAYADASNTARRFPRSSVIRRRIHEAFQGLLYLAASKVRGGQ
jgi:glycosyltransferase involved in cell wall biosynthesis